MIDRRNFLAGAGTVALMPLAAPALVRAQEAVEIRLAHVNPTTNAHHAPAVAACERITAATEGRITFDIFPGGQLGTTTELVEQASQGLPIITYTDAAYMASFGVPELSILAGPFLIDDIEQGFRLHQSPLVQGWFDRLATGAGIRVLGLNWFGGARHVIAKKPVPNPTDMEGVKIRVPPVATWRKTFEPLGAICVTVEAGETYSALTQGVVDAAESPILSLETNNWAEAAPVVTLTSHFELFTGWVISDAVYQTLSEHDRKLMSDEFLSSGKASSETIVDNIAASRGRMEANGVQFVDADIPAYRAATASFYTSFPEWPAGLYDEVRKAATA
jgi:TRAP-type C4-dicarboxylate transport system substrate-binding protein